MQGNEAGPQQAGSCPPATQTRATARSRTAPAGPAGGPAIPPDGHGESLWGAGARADDLLAQAFTLEDVEKRVTGRDGPCR